METRQGLCGESLSSGLPLLPIEETWSLRLQSCSAVQRVLANMAAGHGRICPQETIRYCFVARGSPSEAYTPIAAAYELGYISETLWSELGKQVEDRLRMINGHIVYHKRAKTGATEPGADSSVDENAPPDASAQVEGSVPSDNQ